MLSVKTLSGPCIAVIVAFSHSNLASAQSTCNAPSPRAPQIWKVDNAVAFKTPGLAVDADGAPNSYLVNGKGLSATCDGVAALVDGKQVNKHTNPKNWQSLCQKAWSDAVASGDFSHVAIFGFLTDKQNHPIIQKPGDPLPGEAYITTTSLTIHGTPDRVQRHWVDATKIPYVVLPTKFLKANHVAPGDIAVVYRPKTDKLAFGIYADEGDLGESSVKLHRDLGNEPVVTRQGVARATAGIADTVITVVFPQINVPTSPDAEAWNQAIQTTGNAALERWGGKSRLQLCAKPPAQ